MTAHIDSAKPFSPHIGRTMAKIRRLVATVLCMDAGSIAPTAALVEYGLDSLRAMQIIATIEDRYDIEASDIEIAALHSVADLAQYVTKKRSNDQRTVTPRYHTLPDALAAAAAGERGLRFLTEAQPVLQTYRALQASAQTIAGKLQAYGVKRGDRVLLALPTTPAFARLWWGVQLAGGVPCVLSTALLQQQGSGIARLRTLNATLGASLLLTASQLTEDVAGLNVLTADMLDALPSAPYQPVPLNADDIALIQATSGATSAPKCVALRHRNVLVNVAQIGRRTAVSADDVVVSWLPLFHDMGLVGCFLYAVYWQLPLVLLSPSQFLRRPHVWLEALSTYRGTQSPAPLFAFALTAQRTPQHLLDALDLSRWRTALVCAEPIDHNVLRLFAARFTPAGFETRAYTTAYGLAEASLCVTMQPEQEPVRTETIRRDCLLTNRRAVSADADADSVTVVSCGTVVAGSALRVVDEHGEPLADGEIGRIEFTGPSLMRGYLGQPEQADAWFDTGDRGYLRGGHLYVLGREKELIIIRGQNHYPDGFERAAATVAGVRSGSVMAIGIYDPTQGTEALHVICEVADPTQTQLGEMIRRAIGRETGVAPACVRLVPPRTLPRTTSGKLQRNAFKARYIANAAH